MPLWRIDATVQVAFYLQGTAEEVCERAPGAIVSALDDLALIGQPSVSLEDVEEAEPEEAADLAHN